MNVKYLELINILIHKVVFNSYEAYTPIKCLCFLLENIFMSKKAKSYYYGNNIKITCKQKFCFFDQGKKLSS